MLSMCHKSNMFHYYMYQRDWYFIAER